MFTWNHPVGCPHWSTRREKWGGAAFPKDWGPVKQRREVPLTTVLQDGYYCPCPIKEKSEASRDFIDPRPRGPCGRAIFLTQIWDLLSVGSCLETSCNAEACSPPPPAGVRSGESILQWRSKEHRWPGVLKRQEAVCSKPLRVEETRMV